MPTIIDLSVTLTNTAAHMKEFQIEYLDHAQTKALIGPKLGLNQDEFPSWGHIATESVRLSTHDGTHMDAPWHYAPTSEGKPAKTIDEIPLEWCYGDGVLLDFHHFDRERAIEIADLQEELDQIGYSLKERDIVLIRTDGTTHWLEEDYREEGAGLTAEATVWLLDHGIKVTGIDSWTWDQPRYLMLKRQNRAETYLPAHRLGHKREYLHMESLTNLDKLPAPFGFKVAAFPIKVEGASGAWVRAVAIYED